MKLKIIVVNLFFTVFSLQTFAQSSEPKIRFNGFGDIVAGLPFGSLANQKTNSLYNKYGDDDYPFEMHRGLNIRGVDLLTTVQLSEGIKFQSEINVEGDRKKGGGNFEIEVDRMFLDYKISDKFGLQGGLIYTPIGYINRNLYSRAWLMNSVNFYQAVEQSSGLIQSHFVGVTGYGNIALSNGKALYYCLGLGMPRGKSPTEQIFNSEQLGYQATALLEWQKLTGESELRIGLSGYTDQIHTFYVPNYGDIINTDTSKSLLLQEIGFNPYILFKGKKFDFLAEYHYVMMNVVSGDYPKQTTLNCLSAELAFNGKVGGKRLAPYVRYDFVTLPDDVGPYYGLRYLGEELLTKKYSPNFNAAMIGIAYDITSFNRLKIEYVHHLDGAFQTDGLFFQTAFGF